MSSSVPIPPRSSGNNSNSSRGNAFASSSSSAYRNSSGLHIDSGSASPGSWTPSSAGSSFVGKGKAPVLPSSSSASPSSPVAATAGTPVSPSERERYSEFFSPRRPSLMGSSLSKSEHTVINLGLSDGAPRLVTCVKSSQGFDWNQELFLPSYADRGHRHIEHRQEPVRDIVLTDEEAEEMMPR